MMEPLAVLFGAVLLSLIYIRYFRDERPLPPESSRPSYEGMDTREVNELLMRKSLMKHLPMGSVKEMEGLVDSWVAGGSHDLVRSAAVVGEIEKEIGYEKEMDHTMRGAVLNLVLTQDFTEDRKQRFDRSIDKVDEHQRRPALLPRNPPLIMGPVNDSAPLILSVNPNPVIVESHWKSENPKLSEMVIDGALDKQSPSQPPGFGLEGRGSMGLGRQ